MKRLRPGDHAGDIVGLVVMRRDAAGIPDPDARFAAPVRGDRQRVLRREARQDRPCCGRTHVDRPVGLRRDRGASPAGAGKLRFPTEKLNPSIFGPIEIAAAHAWLRRRTPNRDAIVLPRSNSRASAAPTLAPRELPASRRPAAAGRPVRSGSRRRARRPTWSTDSNGANLRRVVKSDRG